jgi:hypothetical protein
MTVTPLAPVPADRLGVSPDEFVRVLAALTVAWSADESNRYLGGALTAARWVAGHSERHPIRDGDVPCTPAEMASVQMAAHAVVFRWAWAPPGIAVPWARGVGELIAWARGASQQRPLTNFPARPAA